MKAFFVPVLISSHMKRCSMDASSPGVRPADVLKLEVHRSHSCQLVSESDTTFADAYNLDFPAHGFQTSQFAELLATRQAVL